MRRICLCLLIAFASTGVFAREVKHSSPNGDCADSEATHKPAKQKVAPAARTAPVRETRAKPSLHSDSDGIGKPRWHSFLPGMFR